MKNMKNERKFNEWGEINYILNGKVNRENGPAEIHVGGRESWSIKDRYHRENGPSMIMLNGDKRYDYKGTFLINGLMEKFIAYKAEALAWRKARETGDYSQIDGFVYASINTEI